MSRHAKGINLSLSPARKMVCEVLHHARKIPSLPTSRVCDLSPMVKARGLVEQAPSWTAIVLKAIGLVALRRPELRRAYIPWPRPHLYEHPCTMATLLVEREWEDESIILGSRLSGPENQTPQEIDARLKYLQTTPVWDVPHFRKWLRTGSLPSFFRRLIFWHSLYFSGSLRAKRFGTLTLSSLGSLGAEQEHPLTPLTSYFTFGPIDEQGRCVLRVIYDHRVLDDRLAARVLGDVEETIIGDLADQLLLVDGQRPAAVRTIASSSYHYDEELS